MKTIICRTLLLTCVLPFSLSQVRADPALTIYNQSFAVVRDTMPLNLKAGVNRVQVSDITALVEPDSVVLRDLTAGRPLQVLEQLYRADPVSQAYLLSLYEGKTIDFRVQMGDKTEIVPGKIIRSGYLPPAVRGNSNYYNQGSYNYYAGSPVGASQPLIEVNGQLRFSMPGEPLFPALPPDAILKPTLEWQLQSDTAGSRRVELAYVSGGMNWKADYNVVAPTPREGASKEPSSEEPLDLTGWVTLSNTCGKTFENANIKLMAGDVNKIRVSDPAIFTMAEGRVNSLESRPETGVTQKTFDDYHLYSLGHSTTLRDRETKQVEFVRASKVKGARIYIYDGLKLDPSRYNGWGYDSIRSEQNYGTQSKPQIWVMREFANTRENGLGIPLPKGRLRFYQRDTDGQLEFVGENVIDHTPQGETVRMYTGNAFDLVGERKRVLYKIDDSRQFSDETFQITLRNRKQEAAEIRVVEHLYRGSNWAITQKSNPFVKTDSNTIEYRVQVPANGEKIVTYTVHYTW